MKKKRKLSKPKTLECIYLKRETYQNLLRNNKTAYLCVVKSQNMGNGVKKRYWYNYRREREGFDFV